MPTYVNKMREKFGQEVDEANAKAFEALGYKVETKERVDFTKLF